MRFLSPPELDSLDQDFDVILRGIRDPMGDPLTYNVYLLLRNAWSLAYSVFKPKPAPGERDAETLEDRKAMLLEAAWKQDFHEHFYPEGVYPRLDEKGVAVFRFVTTEGTFDNMRRAIQRSKDDGTTARNITSRKRKATFREEPSAKSRRVDTGEASSHDAGSDGVTAAEQAETASTFDGDLSDLDDQPSTELGCEPPSHAVRHVRDLATVLFAGLCKYAHSGTQVNAELPDELRKLLGPLRDLADVQRSSDSYGIIGPLDLTCNKDDAACEVRCILHQAISNLAIVSDLSRSNETDRMALRDIHDKLAGIFQDSDSARGRF